MGCSRVQAETNSIETIEACTGEDVWWSEPSAILQIVRAIETVVFKYGPREVISGP
jgi:hypothetical protein